MRVKQRHGVFCLKAFPNWFIQYFYFVSTVPQTIIFQLILDWFIFSSFFSVLIWLLKHIFIFCTTVPTVTWFEYKENDPLSYKAADICQNPKHWAFDKYLTMVWLTESVLKEGNNFVWKVVLHRDCAAGTLVAHRRGVVVPELLHAKQSHSCSLSNNIGWSMPSFEKWNLLVVTYHVWLPDKLLGMSPRSFLENLF